MARAVGDNTRLDTEPEKQQRCTTGPGGREGLFDKSRQHNFACKQKRILLGLRTLMLKAKLCVKTKGNRRMFLLFQGRKIFPKGIKSKEK